MSGQTINVDIEKFIDFDNLEDNVLHLLTDRVENKQLHAESFHNIAVQAIDAGVRNIIEGKVEELLNKPVPTTNSFGEVVGEPKSFKEMLSESVESAMTKTYDDRGAAKDVTPHNKDRCFTKAEWVVRDVATKGLDKAINAEVKLIRGESEKAIKDNIAAILAKHFSIK